MHSRPLKKKKKTIPGIWVNDIDILKLQMLMSHHPLQLSTFKVVFRGKTTISAIAYCTLSHSIVTQHRTDWFKGFQTNKSRILLFSGRGAWETKPSSCHLKEQSNGSYFSIHKWATYGKLTVFFWSIWPLKALRVKVGCPWLNKRSKQQQIFTSLPCRPQHQVHQQSIHSWATSVPVQYDHSYQFTQYWFILRCFVKWEIHSSSTIGHPIGPPSNAAWITRATVLSRLWRPHNLPPLSHCQHIKDL